MKFYLVAAIVLFISGPVLSTPSGPMSLPLDSMADTSESLIEELYRNTRPTERKFLASCCKTCRKGKACGNSCISRKKSCRKGVGCACDG